MLLGINSNQISVVNAATSGGGGTKVDVSIVSSTPLTDGTQIPVKQVLVLSMSFNPYAKDFLF